MQVPNTSDDFQHKILLRKQLLCCLGVTSVRILKMKRLNLDTWNMFSSRLFLILVRTCIRSSNFSVFFAVVLRLLVMGNCLNSDVSSSDMGSSNSLPIDTIFKLPSPLPSWPSGGGFGRGVMDIGGLQLLQISSFKKIWATYTGGPDNLGVTFFEPSPIPDGFSMLGSYAQPNNQPLFGWVLVGKSDASDQSGQILKSPVDYTQVWVNSSQRNGPEDTAYFWLPKPSDGYRAVGYVITSSPDKPSLDKIGCVRSDFADESEPGDLIWAHNGLNIHDLGPNSGGMAAEVLGTGTFFIKENTANDTSSSTPPLSRLKNNNLNSSSIPNLSQVEALFKTYAPYIYFHPKESYLPSSVNWYFSNGALLYTKGDESKPVPVEPDGSNLPQGGSNDGAYWLDLPIDEEARERVKKGDLQSAEAYIHIKPVLGATFTDIQVWLFYPFNGPATAKIGIFKKVSLGKIGEHVGDWEHLTLRISNFDGVLHKVYFSEHSGGRWVDSSALEFQNGNKFVGYSSLNGHASYSTAGLFLQGAGNIGLRNEAAKSGMVMDTGSRFSVVSAEAAEEVVEPPWLNYAREWGPKISYDFGKELRKVQMLLPGKKLNLLPSEVYGEQGPLGPKMKNVWSGDEI